MLPKKRLKNSAPKNVEVKIPHVFFEFLENQRHLHCCMRLPLPQLMKYPIFELVADRGSVTNAFKEICEMY